MTFRHYGEKTAPTVYSLRSRIDAYHAIQKTDKELLLPRSKEIQETIKKVLKTYPGAKNYFIRFQVPWRWHELQRHVDNRYWYLSQLYKLESQSPEEIFKSRLMPHFWGDKKLPVALLRHR